MKNRRECLAMGQKAKNIFGRKSRAIAFLEESHSLSALSPR